MGVKPSADFASGPDGATGGLGDLTRGRALAWPVAAGFRTAAVRLGHEMARVVRHHDGEPLVEPVARTSSKGAAKPIHR
ncbi:hypothetical protein ACLBWX_13175 [Methylobacterium sp. M6A4_1b]